MVDMERVVTLDDLMDRVPEDLVRDAENRKQEAIVQSNTKEGSMTKELSKAKRIREHMDKHPEARNKDIVDALEGFGVTAADVANVKSQMKRAEGKASSKASAPKPKAAPAAANNTALTSTGPTINWRELDAGVAFVKAAGSIQRAQHLLIIIEQIKAC